MAFFQDGPQTPNLWQQSPALGNELRRRLPDDVFDKAHPLFEALGEDTATSLPRLAAAAEANPPRLTRFDPWGRRIDRIDVDAAWDDLKSYSADRGIVAHGYDDSWGDNRRLIQLGLLQLFSGVSATFSCPLAMTDAAARVLVDHPQFERGQQLRRRLTTTNPEEFITSGQWMTERTGGSDVGGSETIARPSSQGGYRLFGDKWFTSATTSEMALTLARIDDGKQPATQGSRGLTLFCVEVERLDGGGLDGIVVHDLKDKLGTQALPTAELTLDGVRAVALSKPGRGVAGIAPMLNVTRYYNAVASTSGIAAGLGLATDYASRRVAFGQRLIEHPLHRRTLDELHGALAGGLALVGEVATLLGKVDHGSADDVEAQRLRALIPLAKLYLGKRAVACASELLECFGGAGYVETTGLPRILRDAQVLSIWEGTTNVLSLDVLRAEAKTKAMSALLTDVLQRAESLPRQKLGAHGDDVIAFAQKVGTFAREVASLDEGGQLSHARTLSLAVGALCEQVYAAETATTADSSLELWRHLVDGHRRGLFGPTAALDHR